jgi:osmoprotectant transport system substrate-binding protein
MRRLAVVAALVVALSGCGGGGTTRSQAGAAPVITLGTKNFTEQFILGELYRQTLERNGFRVRLKPNIGSSEIIDKALTAGSIDMYPEYTGVLLSEIAGARRRPPSARAAYVRAKRFESARGFTLLTMTPFSDSNALAVLPSFAKAHRLRSIADLRRLPGVTIGALPEFRSRFEGSVGLRSVYGITDARVRPLSVTQRYPALAGGKVQVLAVFTTEGRLSGGRYRLLADPRRLFAFQHLAPVIRTDLVRKYGARLTRPLDALSARLTTPVMRAMNAAVDLRGEKPAAVAARFLRSGSVG